MVCSRLCATVIGLSTVLTGCGAATGQPAVGQPAIGQPAIGQPAVGGDVVPTPSTSAAAAACPGGSFRHLPAHPAGVAAAFVCTNDVRRVPGDGEWSVTIVSRATAGVDRLLRVYAAPDKPIPADVACTADLPDPRVVWLHLASGAVVAVRAPRDACGKPTAEAVAAFDALALDVVREDRVVQVSSQLALDSGCAQQWKDMLRVEASMDAAPPATGSRPTPMPAGPARACVYEVDPASLGEVPDGDLVGARTLDARQVQAWDDALAAAHPDAACARDDHHRFAVIMPVVGGDETYVALDGCAVQQGSAWWRAGDGVRSAVG